MFPVGTGDRNYIGSGVETIEGIRADQGRRCRDCKTILGISNVSFGLPEAGREVLNSVMLYHCVQAGLDLAIVNSEKLERYPSIPEEERQPRRGSHLVARRRIRSRAFAALLPRAQGQADRRGSPLDAA